MRLLLAILLLLFPTLLFAQASVPIPETPDALTEKAVSKYIFYMESNPINYEQDFRKVKEIRLIDRDRYFVSELSAGILYLNSRLNDFPATKEIVILHHLAANNGMEVFDKKAAHVSSKSFDIIEKNEDRFRRQLKYNSPYKYIVEKLIERSPLKSKL